MEIDPLLSQSGGRPPNNSMKSSSNAKKGTSAIHNGKINANPSDSQSKGQVLIKSKESVKNVDDVKNSELGKQFFDAVFAMQSTSKQINAESHELIESSNNNNVKILENITIHNVHFEEQTYVDDEILSISSIEDVFKTVKNKKRKFQGDVNIDLSKCKFKNLNKIDDNINRINKYSLLGDLNIEAERPSSNNFSEPNDPKINNNSQTKVPTRNTYCPPIFLENVNVKSLIDQLNSKNVEFKIKNQSKNKSKLYFKDSSAHSEMMLLLKEKEIPSYTYTPKEYKRQSVVCRGLFYKTDICDIKSEIDKIVPDTVDTVSKFSTEYSRKQGIDTGLFLVILKPNRKVNELLGIKYVLNQVVSWERPKSNSKIPQCWRCQRWGHYSRNCSRPFSCVKCHEKHALGECSIVPESNVLPFCVNCKENGHTSNYRGCPAYKKYLTFRKKSYQEAKNRKISAAGNVAMALNPSNTVVANKSFASMLNVSSEASTQNKTEKPALIQEFMKLAKILCAPDPLTLEDKIYNFMRNYKSMTRDQAKKECLSLINEIQNVYGP